MKKDWIEPHTKQKKHSSLLMFMLWIKKKRWWIFVWLTLAFSVLFTSFIQTQQQINKIKREKKSQVSILYEMLEMKMFQIYTQIDSIHFIIVYRCFVI